MYEIPLRPTGFDPNLYTLEEVSTTTKWEKIYERSQPFIESVTIYNDSTQKVLIAPFENPGKGKYLPVPAKSIITLEFDPPVIYAKRTEDLVSNPDIYVTALFYPQDQVDKAQNLVRAFNRGDKELPFLNPQQIIKISPFGNDQLDRRRV